MVRSAATSDKSKTSFVFLTQLCLLVLRCSDKVHPTAE